MRKWSIVAAIFALLVMPARAGAQTVIYACVGNIGKIVRIVGAGEKCISSPALLAETRVQWNVQGPPGTPGINGRNGANGKDGAPGINGTNGTNGANGTNGTNGTSVTIAGTLLKGDAHCANGGVSLTDGTGTYYLCNGVDGTAGATRAAGPCFDNTNRYVDCGNGTVTDAVTGLIWLKQADCLDGADWATANQAAAGLKSGDCTELTDGSSAGDWRLPTPAEWNATIARASALGCNFAGPGIGPSLTNDAGTGCLLSGGGSSFAFVPSSTYWSSSADETLPTDAWGANLVGGELLIFNKNDAWRVWPVRSGSR